MIEVTLSLLSLEFSTVHHLAAKATPAAYYTAARSRLPDCPFDALGPPHAPHAARESKCSAHFQMQCARDCDTHDMALDCQPVPVFWRARQLDATFALLW